MYLFFCSFCTVIPLFLLRHLTTDGRYLAYPMPRTVLYQTIWNFASFFVIPPTYEVCGVYSFRFSVCPFVRTYFCSYVRLFVRSSFRHRVKVFVLMFIRPHILKTLWWISFIFGMMVEIGLKFLSAPSPPQGWPWGQGHGLWIFIKKSGSKFLH